MLNPDRIQRAKRKCKEAEAHLTVKGVGHWDRSWGVPISVFERNRVPISSHT